MNDFLFIFILAVFFVPFNFLWASWNVPFELRVITTMIGMGISFGTKKYLESKQEKEKEHD